MAFRRLYWAVESQLDNCWNLRGVFTSVHDLQDRGLQGTTPIRVSLVKLDCTEGVLGQWTSPTFGGLRDDMAAYVSTGEFTTDQVNELERTLQAAYSQTV